MCAYWFKQVVYIVLAGSQTCLYHTLFVENPILYIKTIFKAKKWGTNPAAELGWTFPNNL